MAIIEEIQAAERRAIELIEDLRDLKRDGTDQSELPAIARIEAALAELKERIRGSRSEWERNRAEWDSRAAELRMVRTQLYYVPGAETYEPQDYAQGAEDEMQGLRDAINAADRAAAELRYADALNALRTVSRNLTLIEEHSARQTGARLDTVIDELREEVPNLSGRELRERATEFVEDPRRGYQEIHRQQSDEQLTGTVQENIRQASDAPSMTMEQSDAFDALSSAVEEIEWRIRASELSVSELSMAQEDVDARRQEISDALQTDDLRDWVRERLETELGWLNDANTTFHERIDREQNTLVISGDRSGNGIVSTQLEADQRETREQVQRHMEALTGSTSGGILAGFVLSNGGTIEEAESAAALGSMIELRNRTRSSRPGVRPRDPIVEQRLRDEVIRSTQ